MRKSKQRESGNGKTGTGKGCRETGKRKRPGKAVFSHNGKRSFFPEWEKMVFPVGNFRFFLSCNMVIKLLNKQICALKVHLYGSSSQLKNLGKIWLFLELLNNSIIGMDEKSGTGKIGK